MGSCFSKCRTNNRKSDPTSSPLDSQGNVQEKAVISQSLAPPPMLPFPAPPSPSKSTNFSSSSSSLSSCSCTTTSCSTNSSSTLTAKDRSFSNEFLWSCARENLHVIKLSSPIKLVSGYKDSSPASTEVILASPAKKGIPEKRLRPGSPNLSRQKSFRADNFGLSYGPQRMAATRTRSPSPSRRFEGRGSSPDSIPGTIFGQPLVNKQRSFRSASPHQNNGRKNNWVCKQGTMMTGSPLLCPRADLLGVRSVISGRADKDSVEDIDNPIISLDCFIFL
ncbi:hypothetical protein MLD38_034053 [Melastoma candidum]|uniref:Uncharacterized protein n=1 Tax=Melastoma candidum TaxID=119954 RepID=A0ACB9MAJ9_9MYRT|nr:hypothetical protein MLD38_034053 [Melastoma candidum]